ncbi:MAG: DUF4234 domain-containing protein [Tepidisphaeraceae bacterium]|jgi:hypothetical protein
MPVQGASDIPPFKNPPILVLILGLCTCGLYMIYWNMKTAEVLNKVAGKEVIPVYVAILSGFCAPLNAYFYYLAGETLADVGKLIGKEEELKGKGTLLLILGLFVPPVAAMIVQGHLNDLWPDAPASM